MKSYYSEKFLLEFLSVFCSSSFYLPHYLSGKESLKAFSTASYSFCLPSQVLKIFWTLEHTLHQRGALSQSLSYKNKPRKLHFSKESKWEKDSLILLPVNILFLTNKQEVSAWIPIPEGSYILSIPSVRLAIGIMGPQGRVG